MEVKDSGTRRQFEGGSVRDAGIVVDEDGKIIGRKGRCDLMPLREVALVCDTYRRKVDGKTSDCIPSFLGCVAMFLEELDTVWIEEAITAFCLERGWSVDKAMLETAIQYEEGAEKYDDNNWRKVGGGIPAHCYIDSGVRHYLKWADGWVDEPHDRACIWNMLGLLYTLANEDTLPGKGWDDLKFYRDRKEYAAKHTIRKEESGHVQD